MKTNIKSFNNTPNIINLKKQFLKYLLPSVTAMWVFSIYTMVDGIFVSRGVSATALAAVNLSMPYINFIFAISMLFSTGVSTIIAIYLGKKQVKKAQEIFTFNIFCMVICSLIILIISLLFLDKIAVFLGATTDTLTLVKSYLGIILFFNIFFIVSYCLEILTKTDGFPHLAILGMIISAITNILLDYLIVIKLNWGIKGAALATGISQMVSCLFFLYHFLRFSPNLKFVRFRFSFSLLGKILSIGFPDAITELTSGIVILIFNQSILKFIGEDGVITYSIICYINTLVTMTMIGITQGVQPLCSYYFGKEDLKTIKKLLYMSFKTVTVVSIIIFIISIVFGKEIVSIFINKNDLELFSSSVNAFRIFSFSFLFLGYNILTSGFCASVEKPLNATIISLSRGFVIILISLIIMILLFGGKGIWISTIISESLCLIISCFIFKQTIRSIRLYLSKSKNNNLKAS